MNLTASGKKLQGVGKGELVKKCSVGGPEELVLEPLHYPKSVHVCVYLNTGKENGLHAYTYM